MDKPDSRKNRRKPIIIEQPEALSDLRKGTEWSLTAIGWGIWIALCRPVLLAMLWFVGLRQAYVHMVKLGGASSLLAWFTAYSLIIAVVGILIIGWHTYNRKRFRNKERRRRVADTTNLELAESFHMSEKELQHIHQQNVITVSFLEKGLFEFHASGKSRVPLDKLASGRYRYKA